MKQLYIVLGFVYRLSTLGCYEDETREIHRKSLRVHFLARMTPLNLSLATRGPFVDWKRALKQNSSLCALVLFPTRQLAEQHFLDWCVSGIQSVFYRGNG